MDAAILYALALAAVAAVLVGIGRAVMRAKCCPRCGSSRQELRGEWKGVRFYRCAMCGSHWEVSDKEK